MYGVITGSEVGFDKNNDMFKISSMQKKFRDSFTGTELDSLKWELSMQTGASISVGSGVLTFSSGTDINTESYILSKEVFTIPFKLSIGLTLSQRIINQTFYVEAVSVNPETLKPDGRHSAAILFDGTTATQGKYLVQNGGIAPLISAASTLPTTASGGYYEIEPFGDECWFHGGTLDNTNGRANSYRRHQQIPDPNALYKIRLRWVNGGTAPASSTNAIIQYMACQDYAELTAEITSGRGNSVAGQGIYATITGSVAGTTAHDSSASSTNPVKVGGRALTTNITVSATGDLCDFITTMTGAQIVKPFSIPELDWQYASTAIVNTTDVALKTAGAAGIRNYITSFQYQNTHATVATEIVIKDGSTVIWRASAPALMGMPVTVTLNTPLRGTAATAMNFACVTTGANVYVNAQGFQAP